MIMYSPGDILVAVKTVWKANGEIQILPHQRYEVVSLKNDGVKFNVTVAYQGKVLKGEYNTNVFYSLKQKLSFDMELNKIMVNNNIKFCKN